MFPRGGTLAPTPTTSRPLRGQLFPLLDRARFGDRAALEIFLGRIRPELNGIASVRFRGRWMEPWAEDVVQEVLIDVLRGVEGCQAASESEVWAWLRAILRRQILLLVRREASTVAATIPLSEVPEVAAPYVAGTSPAQETRLEALRHATDGLRPEQEALLWLRIQTHATWREIGEELHVSASAAKRRYQRLIQAMRRVIHPLIQAR